MRLAVAGIAGKHEQAQLERAVRNGLLKVSQRFSRKRRVVPRVYVLLEERPSSRVQGQVLVESPDVTVYLVRQGSRSDALPVAQDGRGETLLSGRRRDSNATGPSPAASWA